MVIFGTATSCSGKSYQSNGIIQKAIKLFVHHFWIPRITKIFIFSDNEDGSLKDIMLIDMQIMRIANPSIDLVYLLYSSSNNDDRKEKVTQWLKIYHDTLTDDLKALGYSGTEYPFHELEKDIDHARLFGVIMGLMHCQVTNK